MKKVVLLVMIFFLASCTSTKNAQNDYDEILEKTRIIEEQGFIIDYLPNEDDKHLKLIKTIESESPKEIIIEMYIDPLANDISGFIVTYESNNEDGNRALSYGKGKTVLMGGGWKENDNPTSGITVCNYDFDLTNDDAKPLESGECTEEDRVFFNDFKKQFDEQMNLIQMTPEELVEWSNQYINMNN